ncbi:unnamed protein product [Musa acuminata subsp. malaccensis]|uniref:(wild Malaysian banana) hypothetical protein n=1 Tax=Musa acuminata subsp. malaccensis TaxID=214687 RepID=A0A804L7C9_MUSAM|nr:unnamed protein product [Musa acuminata subsp. malaccensis]
MCNVFYQYNKRSFWTSPRVSFFHPPLQKGDLDPGALREFLSGCF